ncbi:MAG TPA: UDP-N-acetylmuramoyl-L-alanine--D-glutamate ligase [Acetobacteraceae bacterium]|nr:UDP-N-acetylmuramoyl-L-alanine--D-glutamate ligase [Acetobacteraceae bacterium]
MSTLAFPPVFAGRRFAVMGLGRNGLPTAEALVAMGAEVSAWDDDGASRDTASRHGIHLANPLAGMLAVDALILSPGIPHIFPAPHPVAARAAEQGIPILSDAELLFQAVRAAGSRAGFIGITGTNGKSTTTALIAHILKTAGVSFAAGGNLGPAALALPLLPDAGYYVLEMSSYMLERISELRFEIATLLNLSPDHLDRHGGMEGYIAAKKRIFAQRTPQGLAVIGIDDQLSCEIAASLAPPLARISGESAADVWCESGTLCDRIGPILAMHEASALPGTHNAQNAAAAAAVALAAGVARPALAAAIRSYPGLPHRQQSICRIGGIEFINDSKATNADSVARALACYPRVVWIAGGIAKEGGIESLERFFPRLAEALLIGRDAPLFAATLARCGVPYRIVGRLEDAVPAAYEAARARSVPVVLLSPAAASFDQFQGFPERGERFAGLARALATRPQEGRAA